VTWAVLKLDGKVACSNERLANLDMTGAKVLLHCLISDVGNASSGDDLVGIDLISRSTSVAVTGWNSNINVPQNDWSDSSGSNC